jgi:hypothetical protein
MINERISVWLKENREQKRSVVESIKLLQKAGDKFTVISWQSAEKVCCISLIKADEFADTVKNMLGPMLGEIVKQ